MLGRILAINSITRHSSDFVSNLVAIDRTSSSHIRFLRSFDHILGYHSELNCHCFQHIDGYCHSERISLSSHSCNFDCFQSFKLILGYNIHLHCNHFDLKLEI
jgi:hypothetical protein